MQMIFNIDLPKPPEEVLNEVLDIGTNHYNDPGIRQHIVGYPGEVEFGSDPFDRRNRRRRSLDVGKGVYARVAPTTALKEFMYSILPDYGLTDDMIGIQTTINRHFPHTDRYYSRLIYRVSGEPTTTSWFVEKGHDLVRTSGLAYLDYNIPTLEQVDSGVLENGNWYLLIANVIHGVMDNKDKRISITVPMEEWQATKLLQKHTKVE
jgi:hypothetical protein